MTAPRERLIQVLTRIRDLGERSLFFIPEPDGPTAVPDAVLARTVTGPAAVSEADTVIERGEVGEGRDPDDVASARTGMAIAGGTAGERAGGDGVLPEADPGPGGECEDTGAVADDPVEAHWRDAETRVRTCTRCRLCETRTHAVFGSGTRRTRLFVIGEGPGHQEDLRAEAFVGPAGQLLTKILHAVGFERDEVFITNVVKCRPPGNRAPLPDEVAACAGYLEEQLEMVRPAAILLLGASAARAVLGTTASIGSLRGVVHRLGDVPVLVTYHPAALLRNPDYKRPTWEDVQLLRRVHDERVAAEASGS